MKKLLALLLVLIPLAAQARFEQLSNDVNSLFNRMSGYVVSVDDSGILSDLGTESNIYKGLVLKVYRESEEIIHPITKEVLGRKKSAVGDVSVEDVFERYSVLNVVGTADVKVGDLVVLNPPVEVAVKTVNVPTRIELLIKESLSRGSNIVLKDDAQISLVFTHDDKGGISMEAKDNKTDILIASAYYSDLETGDVTRPTKDSFRSKSINAEYDSMTVGRILNKDDIHIAASLQNRVDFYKFTGKSFEKITELSRDFKKIVSVESVDLNNNGIEEVFVTWLEFDKFPRTDIFEYNGTSFELKAEKLPFISRVTYDKGQKMLLTQRMSPSGEFSGQIQVLEYRNGAYERTVSVPGSGTQGIFGFGLASYGDNKKNAIYIDNDFKLNIEREGKVAYTSSERFSQTPKYLDFQEEKSAVGPNKRVPLRIRDAYEYDISETRRFIKGRIFVNSEGRLYLIKNEAFSDMLPNTFAYKGSSFAVYSWQNDTMSRVWISDVKEPVIVDYYMFEEYGRTYLFMLRNISGGIFKKSTSEFEYIETR